MSEIELPEEFGSDTELDGRMKSVFEVPDEVRAEERAKTERRERTGLAEWSLGKCTEHPPYTGWHRHDCPECTWATLEALREGKAPTPSGQWPEGE